jgi:hypothetical protein
MLRMESAASMSATRVKSIPASMLADDPVPVMRAQPYRPSRSPSDSARSLSRLLGT